MQFRFIVKTGFMLRCSTMNLFCVSDLRLFKCTHTHTFTYYIRTCTHIYARTHIHTTCTSKQQHARMYAQLISFPTWTHYLLMVGFLIWQFITTSNKFKHCWRACSCRFESWPLFAPPWYGCSNENCYNLYCVKNVDARQWMMLCWFTGKKIQKSSSDNKSVNYYSHSCIFAVISRMP